jgi:PST family polysaccharide transporter
MIGVSFLVTIGLFLCADILVKLIGGAAFRSAAEPLRWLAFLPTIMSFSTFIGLQILLPNLHYTAFNVILGCAAALSLIIVAPLIHWLGLLGAAFSSCLVEGFVSIAMIAYVAKSGLLSKTPHSPKEME